MQNKLFEGASYTSLAARQADLSYLIWGSRFFSCVVPQGYLKTARCYRLLKKLKAAQKMLDMAVERADDESTIRAARTEQRKITEDIQALAEERRRVSNHNLLYCVLQEAPMILLTRLAFFKPFADQLPEEIFLHVASYLSQRDLVRAAQVNQTWRAVLHSHSHLWTTMYLNMTVKDTKKRHPSSSSSAVRRERPIDNQIRFYEDRLPEGGSRNLLHLSLHVQAAPTAEMQQMESPIGKLLLAKHRFIKSAHLQSLALSGEALSQLTDFVRLLSGPVKVLHSLRIAGEAGQQFNIKLVDLFPQLKAVDIVADDRSAEYESSWPHTSTTSSQTSQLATANSTTTSSTAIANADPSRSRIEHLVAQRPLNVGHAVRSDIEAANFEHCQHLEIGGGPFSFFFEASPMVHLRTIILHNTLFNPSFTLLGNVNPFDATDSLAVENFLEVPLDFPFLETFKIIYADTNEPGNWGRITRHRLRPSLYLCRLNAPKLRHLTIKNFGPITPVSTSISTREHHAWRSFCEQHPLLEELVLFKTTITDLSQSLPLLPALAKLLLSYVDLPSHFLKSATSPTLPHLKQLAVSHCSNITSGDLVRLVQSKGKQLDYLDIETCTDLQKEAVDWLKANVAEVKWSGWRDKNEKRPFMLRA